MKRIAKFVGASCVSIAAWLLTATPASAADVLFTISGDYSAQFRLNQSPVINPDYVFDGWLFAVTGIPDFADSTNGLADVSFFNANYGGGLLINDDGDPFYWLLDATDGKQYYSGSEAAPTFTIGNYNLHGLGTPGEFALSIAAIPEPESWALLICGFGGVGVALRVRRRRAATI